MIEDSKVKAVLNLVDLAGSEKIKQSNKLKIIFIC